MSDDAQSGEVSMYFISEGEILPPAPSGGGADVPTVPFTVLPAHTGTVGLQLVAVHDNNETVRVSWGVLNAEFLHSSDAQPSGTTSTGGTLQCYVGDDGFYTWNTQGWGKSPRLTANWDDTTASSTGSYARFLVVHKEQGLTQGEKEQGRKNLGIDIASEDAPGLVKQGETTGAAPVYVSDAGTMSVPPATEEVYGSVLLVTEDSPYTGAAGRAVGYSYFMEKWGGLPEYVLPAATYTSLGGVVPAEDDFDISFSGDIVGVVHTKKASYSLPGYVKKMDYSTWSSLYSGGVGPVDSTTVPEYAIVKELVDNAQSSVASYNTPGLVRLSAMVGTDTTGGLRVRTANATDLGVVKVSGDYSRYSAFSSDATTVPTAYGAYQYADARIEDFSGSLQFPSAYAGSLTSSYTLGGIHPSETYFEFYSHDVRDSSTGTVIDSYIALRPKKATPTREGVVFVTNEYSPGTQSVEDQIKTPTVNYVSGYVGSVVDPIFSELEDIHDDINDVRGMYEPVAGEGSVPYSDTSLYALDMRVTALEERVSALEDKVSKTITEGILDLVAQLNSIPTVSIVWHGPTS